MGRGSVRWGRDHRPLPFDIQQPEQAHCILVPHCFVPKPSVSRLQPTTPSQFLSRPEVSVTTSWPVSS